MLGCPRLHHTGSRGCLILSVRRMAVSESRVGVTSPVTKLSPPKPPDDRFLCTTDIVTLGADANATSSMAATGPSLRTGYGCYPAKSGSISQTFELTVKDCGACRGTATDGAIGSMTNFEFVSRACLSVRSRFRCFPCASQLGAWGTARKSDASYVSDVICKAGGRCRD